MGNYKAAALDAQKGLAINPSDQAVMQELSFAYNYGGAMTTRSGLPLYAFALEGVGKSEKADAQAAQALREETFPARAHLMRGEMLRYRGQFNEAIESYSAGIALEPTYALGVIERGVTYFRLNQFKNALIDFDQATQLNPDSSLGLAWKALAEEKLGQHDAADRDIEKAMNAPTVTADVLANHAAIELERGHSTQAKSLAEQAVKMNPYHADAYAILSKPTQLHQPWCGFKSWSTIL